MHGHIVIERWTIRQVTDLGPNVVRLLDNVEASDFHGAAGGQQVTGQNTKSRGFTGTIQAEQTHDFPALNRRRYRPDCASVAHSTYRGRKSRSRFHPLVCRRASRPARRYHKVSAPGPR